MSLRTTLPAVAPILYDIKTLWRAFVRRPSDKQHCPCCNHDSMFRAFGLPPRLNARCPRCGSLERHRLQRIFLDANPDVVVGRDILQFAPERQLRDHLAGVAKSYIGCDLNPAEGDMMINIEDVALPDDAFDLIICNHVLEHVDDKKALAELRRILRPGGTLLVMVPIVEGWEKTYENPEIVTPQQRLVHFGQEDHLRMYGADIRQRFRSAGFKLEEVTAEEPNVSKYGLWRGEKMFICY